MAESVFVGRGIGRLDKLGRHQLVQGEIAEHRRQQLLVESRTDHRSGVECPFRCRAETVDARRDGGLHGSGHRDIAVASTDVSTPIAVEDPALGQIADDLLGEEGVSRAAFGNAHFDRIDRRVRP